MTDQSSALGAAGRAPCRLPITTPIPSIALDACVVALSLIAIPPAQAKQACSAAAGSSGYWSWRMIDGRKCWYQGKPMLAKSSLEWPAETPAHAESAAHAASVAPEQRGDPMDAEASLPDGSSTFDALWRSRIENR